MLGKRRPPRYGPFLPWIVPLHKRLADARSFTVRGLSGQVEAKGFRLVGVGYIMPPFKFFGMALILVLEKV